MVILVRACAPQAPLSRYLPYWSVDPEDRRSRVTLRHCLGFITGYEDHSNAGPRPDSPDPFEPPCANSSSANFKLCAEKLYHRANITYEPGPSSTTTILGSFQAPSQTRMIHCAY